LRATRLYLMIRLQRQRRAVAAQRGPLASARPRAVPSTPCVCR
jgi:hypothetical protein